MFARMKRSRCPAVRVLLISAHSSAPRLRISRRSWWVGAALIAMFFAIYVPVIRGEEAFLRRGFPEFEAYAKAVPRTSHDDARLSGPAGGFSMNLYLKHRETTHYLAAVAMQLL